MPSRPEILAREADRFLSKEARIAKVNEKAAEREAKATEKAAAEAVSKEARIAKVNKKAAEREAMRIAEQRSERQFV